MEQAAGPDHGSVQEGEAGGMRRRCKRSRRRCKRCKRREEAREAAYNKTVKSRPPLLHVAPRADAGKIPYYAGKRQFLAIVK